MDSSTIPLNLALMNMETIAYTEVQELLMRHFEATGLDREKAAVVTSILLEGELMGHSTHGLQLVKPYLTHLHNGSMETKGTYTVLNQMQASQLWDGRYLPGPWLVQEAIATAKEMASTCGTGTVVIQASSHIGCLAAYMEAATADGSMILLACSDPDNATVAPFGGTTPVYSPDPLAMGIPTGAEPIIIDISMSATSNGHIHMKKQQGQLLEHPWLLTPDGETTTDPERYFETPPATILPLGGLDSGYKGFALGIMIEALTAALGGHGRVSHPNRWGASVFLQVINPGSFSGESYIKKEMEHFKHLCLKSTPAKADKPVRMPGQRGLALKKKYLAEGLPISAELLHFLQKTE